MYSVVFPGLFCRYAHGLGNGASYISRFDLKDLRQTSVIIPLKLYLQYSIPGNLGVIRPGERIVRSRRQYGVLIIHRNIRLDRLPRIGVCISESLYPKVLFRYDIKYSGKRAVTIRREPVLPCGADRLTVFSPFYKAITRSRSGVDHNLTSCKVFSVSHNRTMSSGQQTDPIAYRSDRILFVHFKYRCEHRILCQRKTVCGGRAHGFRTLPPFLKAAAILRRRTDGYSASVCIYPRTLDFSQIIIVCSHKKSILPLTGDLQNSWNCCDLIIILICFGTEYVIVRAYVVFCFFII